MKKWEKPVIVTIDESELINLIKVGACSTYVGCLTLVAPRTTKK